MIRQTLSYKAEYLKYPFVKEMENLWNIFSDDDIQSNSKDVVLHEASKFIVSSMEDGIGRKCQFEFKPNQIAVEAKNVVDDKFILCCVSGGKDSLAVVLHYIELGYNVCLYTVRGINKGYPEEYKSAINLAERLGLPIYVDEVKLSGKKYYVEHPLKNQFIACLAIVYCLENKFPPHIAFGDYQKDTNSRSNWGVNWTDNFELWKQFNLFIKCFVDGAVVEIPFYEEAQALEVLNKNSNLVPLYQSCLMTVRDRESLRQKNQKKYGVKILPNRCGSCYKCCLEYIYFCDHNKLEYNEGFYRHCLDVLKKKYTDYTGSSSVADLSTQRGVYEAYFGKSISRYLDSEKWSDCKNLELIDFGDEALSERASNSNKEILW